MNLREILNVKGTAVHTISPSATLAQVVDFLVDHNCGSLVVCAGDDMVGIITERDILRACSDRKTALEERTVEDVMSTDLVTATPSDEVESVMGLMTENRIRHMPVLEDDKLAGLISIGDVVKAQHDLLTLENHMLKSYLQT